MTIKRQLQILIAIALITLLAMIGSSVYGLNQLSQLLNNVNTEAAFYQKNVNLSRQAQIEFQRQVQEWKNILIRGNDPELYKKYYDAFLEKETTMDNNLNTLKRNLATHGDNEEPVNALIDAHRALGEKYRAALTDQWVADDETSGKRVDLAVRGIDRETSKKMDTLAEELQKTSEKTLTRIKEEADQSILFILSLVVGIAMASLAILIVVSGKISKNIITLLGSEPMALVSVFKALANGDLTVKVPLKEGDRTSMAAQLAMTQRKMLNMIRAVKNGAQELQQLSDLETTEENTHPRRFAESAQKAVTGLNEAISRFQVEKDGEKISK